MRIVAHQGAPKSMCICSIHHCALPGGHKELSPKESKGNSPIIWIESGIDGSNGVGLSGKKSKTISLALLDSSTTAAEEVSEEVSEELSEEFSEELSVDTSTDPSEEPSEELSEEPSGELSPKWYFRRPLHPNFDQICLWGFSKYINVK